MRFSNLEAEIKRANLNVEEVASALDYDRVTLYNRLSGKTKWTLIDMLKVQSFFRQKTGQQFTLDYLFQMEQ